MKKTLLTLGHGYCANALSHLLLPLGWTIYGATRFSHKKSQIRGKKVVPVTFSSDAIKNLLSEVSHILVSAAPTEDGDPVLAELQNEIKEIVRTVTWVGYLSTTGVYGDHAGGWVNEQTPLSPSTSRGRLRKFAEEQWQAIPDLPLHIFRIASIYGPGRTSFSKLRKGTARRIIKTGQVFNRIHVDDIAQILMASINKPNSSAIYNLCDDTPAPPQDVIAFSAKLLNIPAPPEISIDKAGLGALARSFFAENKKVRNDHVKKDLGVTLRYPNYKVGLQQLHADGE
ncbi:MAG: SDR family oxidoreductase [Aestuariivita sp.]|nr:SDR family oxidoreductase [Aestuariivita sp.]